MQIGCNYWASHAGTRMWELWDEDIVRADLKRLAEIGCELIRVFPNWRDFQPIEICYAHRGTFRDISMRGTRLPATPCGHAGVDELMLRRFRKLAEIAEENGLRLVVSLVTGWMSGSYYTPPALEKLNPLTDPVADPVCPLPGPGTQGLSRHSDVGARQRMQLHGRGCRQVRRMDLELPDFIGHPP